MNILICTFLALLQFVEILFSSSKCISFICWASHAHSLLFRDIRGRTITPSTRTQFRIVSYPIREPSLFHISHIHIFSTFCLKIGYPHFFHGISPFSLFKWIRCAYLDQQVDTSSLRHTRTHPNIVHLHSISILYYSSMISIYQ